MSKKGNVLILSTGRCVELIQDFKTEAAKFSDGTRILTIDMSPRMSSTCHVSDGAFPVPSIQPEGYIDRIFDLTAEEDAGLIIPTIDIELYKLPEARTHFEGAGIHIVISSSELITLYHDKRETAGLFARHGIHSPEIYDRNCLVYPCFIKPYNGSRTIGARRLNQAADLTPEILADSKLTFCQLIDIAEELQEFTVDMYCDRKGRLKRAVPRKRLGVRTGKISKGTTRRNSPYGLPAENMTVPEGARGCITAQFFFNGCNDTPYDVKISSHFSGGFPLTYATGGNYPGRLIREYLYGEEVLFSDRRENNLIILRYDAKVLVREQD